MTDPIEPKNRGLMWLAIMGMTVLFAAAILMLNKNEPLPASILQATQTNRPPRLYSVYYRNGVFSPTNLRIQAKDSVAFRNDSQATIEIDGAFGPSGDLAPSAVHTHVFTEAGTYEYFNTGNNLERGTITVRP